MAAAGADFLDPGIHMPEGFVVLRASLTVVLTGVALALLLGLPSRRWARWFGGMPIMLVVATMLFGEDIVVASIDRYRANGAAIVTGRFATSTQFNRHDVIGYRVLIATADRGVVAANTALTISACVAWVTFRSIPR